MVKWIGAAAAAPLASNNANSGRRIMESPGWGAGLRDLVNATHDAAWNRQPHQWRGGTVPYSSCRRHHVYGSPCGQPAGESSQLSWRPKGVRSSSDHTVPIISSPRALTKYVRNTSSPSRRKTLKPGASPWSVVTPMSRLKSLPSDEYHGRSQPMRLRKRSMFASGASDTKASDVSRACRCEGWHRQSTNIEQPWQPASGQPCTEGANMKW